MLVELVEVQKGNHCGGQNPHRLEKVFINPEHIVSVRCDEVVCSMFKEGKLPWKELLSSTSFSVITLNGGGMPSSITVVGSPEIVQKKCFESKRREILRG